MKTKQLFFIQTLGVLSLLLALLSSCSDDDYYYPAGKQEFLTAYAGVDGKLEAVLTDEGEKLAVLEDASNIRIEPNTSVRIVSYYGKATDGTSGVKLYAVSNTISPVPQPVESFKEGVKYDPANVLSIWMGIDYLNMMLDIKGQTEKHMFHFLEEDVVTDMDAGHCNLFFKLYHDAGGDVQAYTKRAYASVPLRSYVKEGIHTYTVYFSLYTYENEVKTYRFEYHPK